MKHQSALRRQCRSGVPLVKLYDDNPKDVLVEVRSNDEALEFVSRSENRWIVKAEIVRWYPFMRGLALYNIAATLVGKPGRGQMFKVDIEDQTRMELMVLPDQSIEVFATDRYPEASEVHLSRALLHVRDCCTSDVSKRGFVDAIHEFEPAAVHLYRSDLNSARDVEVVKSLLALHLRPAIDIFHGPNLCSGSRHAVARLARRFEGR